MLFADGTTRAEGRVTQVSRFGERWAVIADRTPFHPLDHSWPDQPADRGTLAGQPVLDCLIGAFGPDGQLLIGDEIPVRRGEAGWTWVVVHITGDPVEPDAPVVLEVDADYRRSLSQAHTACHLAALALNRVTAGLWRKDPPRRDSLGSPDLDGLAITESRIEPGRSLDSYRLGKSLRKKGLDTAALLAALPRDPVAAQLRQWIATGAPVRIDNHGDSGVAARRTWTCPLDGEPASYPCGGTHVASLAELPAVAVDYRVTDDGFVAETTVG